MPAVEFHENKAAGQDGLSGGFAVRGSTATGELPSA
jgi:hypothetical protein